MKNEMNLNDLQLKKDQVLDELTTKYIYGGDLTIYQGPIYYHPKFPIMCLSCMPACAFIPTPVVFG